MPTKTSTTSTFDRRTLERTVADLLNRPRSFAGTESADTVLDRGRWLLDSTLAQLTALGVAVPDGVQRALDISAALTARPTGASLFLADPSLDKLTPAEVADRLHAFLVASVAANSDGAAGREAALVLLERAIDDLADRSGDITEQLRPTWDAAAQVVADAAAAGLRPGTSGEQAIADPVLTEHWRVLPDAVDTLDRIEHAMVRLLFTVGGELGFTGMARRGRDRWLDESGSGPIRLASPAERTTRTVRAGGVAENSTALARDVADEHLHYQRGGGEARRHATRRPIGANA